MRICIGNRQTKKFVRMVEVLCVEPCPNNDCVIYLYDSMGRFATFAFPDRKALETAMLELRDHGFSTIIGEYELYREYEMEEYDEHEREIDFERIEERNVSR